MAAAPLDTHVSDNLSQLRIAQSTLTMPASIKQPTQGEKAKPTLETLPPEIKNEIFSHLLLGAKVKYSTDGSWPGYKYRFDATIMRTSKQMNEDASAYLHRHNEFALIHSKFFAFEIDKKRFLPTIATGKAAGAFAKPAIEATVTHLGTDKCSCCNPKKHQAKDRVTHALFLVADLEHFTRELRLTFHMWPSQPIYILSAPNVSPVQHIPVNVDTQVKIVWKVNPASRQDLNDVESRAGHSRLLAPLDFPMGFGKKISILGVGTDEALKITDQIMPRILSVDAAGWDLYCLMKSQKAHLDNVLSQNPSSLSNLICSYMDLACLGHQLEIPGHWHYASVVRTVNNHGEIVSLCLMPFDELDDEEYESAIAGSWQVALLCLVLDSLFTVVRLAMEDVTFKHFPDCIQIITDMITHIFRGKSPFPKHYISLLGHYMVWLMLHQDLDRDPDTSTLGGRGVALLANLRTCTPEEEETDVYRHLIEDQTFLSKVVLGEAEALKEHFGAFTNPCINFQGLLNRPRLHKTPFQPKPAPHDFQGWTTKRQPKPEVAAHMIDYMDRLANMPISERSPVLRVEALDRGHDPIAFLNLPREPEPEPEQDLFSAAIQSVLPPGLIPAGATAHVSVVAMPW
ncbi:hypothetical protein D6C83_07715 [Aureobasidium pullulans]|uniref:Uncharacterized protein n=1 Tax=Aureobasidium pullulans TaxID=5580 RepID=A0A4V4LCM6_AURPU|nr:hypothetical protein D6C83_07715 [Aureobasidium pullulans]